MLDDFVHISKIFQTIYFLDEMEEGFEDPITTSNDIEWVTYNTMDDKILFQNILTRTHGLKDEMQQEILTTIPVGEEGLEEIIMSNDFDNVSKGIEDDDMLQTILLSDMLLEEAFECSPTTTNNFEGFTNHTMDDEMLQNMLIELLAEQGLEESTISSNDFVEIFATLGLDSQNLDIKQEDPMFYSPTNVSQSDDDVSISDLINILPIFLYEVHNEEYPDEPTIGMSLGCPIFWLDWMEFSTTTDAMSQHHQ